MNSDAPPPGGFPTTHWSLVGRAGGSDMSQARDSLAALLQAYMPVLKAHLVHRKRLDSDEADEVLQDLVAHKILEKGLLASADPSKGRFRSLLLTTLDRMIIDRYRRQKRRRCNRPLPPELELPAPAEPNRDAFDRDWAEASLARALREMKRECQAKNQAAMWYVFVERWMKPLFHGTPAPDFERLAGSEYFDSPDQARNCLASAKRKFHRKLTELVHQYTMDAAEAATEIQLIKSVITQLADTSPVLRRVVDEPFEHLDDSSNQPT